MATPELSSYTCSKDSKDIFQPRMGIGVSHMMCFRLKSLRLQDNGVVLDKMEFPSYMSYSG
jgi:hypothetical protein